MGNQLYRFFINIKGSCKNDSMSNLIGQIRICEVQENWKM